MKEGVGGTNQDNGCARGDVGGREGARNDDNDQKVLLTYSLFKTKFNKVQKL